MGQLITAEQLGELLNVGAEQVRKLTREGVLPHHRIGGAIRYDFDEVKRATKVPERWKLNEVMTEIENLEYPMTPTQVQAARDRVLRLRLDGDISEHEYLHSLGRIDEVPHA